MTTPTEFRKFADECMASAQTAATEAERKAFLDMARAWTLAAVEVSGQLVITPIAQPDDSDHPSPSH